MNFVSTRGRSQPLNFSSALREGLAPDGGLYVPEAFPKFDLREFELCKTPSEVASVLLKPFLKDDPLEGQLVGLATRAFNFSIPLKPLARDTSALELFHGPTAAFKDVGARFLAECLMELRGPSDPLETVLVATSGDTGGAVAGAFHGKAGIEVWILFPKGWVSPRQEKQLTCWGNNVRAFAVKGDFDACQQIAKAAFNDPLWRKRKKLISANSISVGRLLPQMVYYAWASLKHLRQHKRQASFIVPTGNLGNAVAALWAKRAGLPIREVVLATNANRALGDFFKNGTWQPEPTVRTLANAMDVGSPSNVERLTHLYPNFEDLKREVKTLSSSDAQIEATIRNGERDWGEIWCPHTATAVHTREQLSGRDWIVVATAHPAKFESIVEPLIGHSVDIPPELKILLSQSSHVTEIDASLESLERETR